MKRVLVVGNGGMAGHMVLEYLQELGKYEMGERYYPSASEPELWKALRRDDPDVIVNAAGILVEASETDRARAISTNALLPNSLSAYCASNGGRVIHLSTDCVFAGDSVGNYHEDFVPDGTSVYARTKALGELNNRNDLTFRTSFIGPELPGRQRGLFEWFMAQAGEVPGYENVIWTGITTLELARAIDAAIDQNLTGLYHLASYDTISKFNLLRLIAYVWEKSDVTIVPVSEPRSDRSLICTRSDFDYTIPTHAEMLEQLRGWMHQHPDLYKTG